MKKAGLVVILSFAVFMTPAVLIGQNNEPNNKISIDTLLWIQTVVGGRRTPSPKWSPDGKEVVFHAFRTENRDIFVVSADGGTARPLTNDAGQDMYPHWSPDGKRVVRVGEVPDRLGEKEVPRHLFHRR